MARSQESFWQRWTVADPKLSARTRLAPAVAEQDRSP